MTDSPSDLERRLTATLDATADDVRPGAVPAFSWQQPPSSGRRSRRRAGLAAGGALVAAAAAAAVVVAVLPDGEPAPAGTARHEARSHPIVPKQTHPRSASVLLLTAAHSRLVRGDAPLAAGQYRYIRTVGPGPDVVEATPADSSAAPTTHHAPPGSYTLDELWIPKDVTDVWLRRQSTHGTSADDTVSWRGRCGDLYADTQDGPTGDACTRPGAFDDLTPAFVTALPRDADALFARIRAYAAQHLNPDKDHDVDSVMFRTVNDLLTAGMVTSDLTSTLYTVLSRIPGIVAREGVANAEGVRGTGFTLSTVFGRGADASRYTTTVIVDLDSGAYLGYAQTGSGQHYRDAVSEGVSDRIGVAGD